MTFRQLEKIVKSDGWYRIKSKGGSHIQFEHATKQGKVTIPCHSGDIPQGTINSVLRQAGLK